MEKNYVKKELMKSKEMASFSHYIAGNMYYHVKVGYDVYQFPVPTVETEDLSEEDFDGEWVEDIRYHLSSDLGTTSFTREMKGSLLNRWISMAIDSNEFIMIEVPVSPI
jgi:hypothetical protein